MQRLADYIGLPCRIARGCKYCAADHRSTCLVKIKDDKQLSRFKLFLLYMPLITYCTYNFVIHLTFSFVLVLVCY